MARVVKPKGSGKGQDWQGQGSLLLGRRTAALYRIGQIRANLGVRTYTQLFGRPDLAALDGCLEWLQQPCLAGLRHEPPGDT